MTSLGMQLTADREDGSLLRAKATPNGMVGYLIGMIAVVSGTIMLTVAGLLIVGLAPFGGLALGRTVTWLMLAWVLALGLLATLPIGAGLGSLFPWPRPSGYRAPRCTPRPRRVVAAHPLRWRPGRVALAA